MSDLHVESVVRRFHKYTVKTDGCWEWIGSKMVRGGYGQLNDRGRLLKAHRVSYEIHKGRIPEGLFICHKCNNPKCVNPDHLYAGTPKDNNDDTAKAGNSFVPNGAKGEKHHHAKLNWEKVRFIRTSEKGHTELAKLLNVTKSAIFRVRKGLSWKETT